MSDIFVSYAKEDRERAGQLAQALTGLGWSVFWDRVVPAGLSWREFIGRELEEARSVVVAWSDASAKSPWVLEEAEQAKRKGILIPVSIEPVEPPLGFGSLQAADLSSWDGSADAPPFRKLVEDMARVLGSPPGGGQEGTPRPLADAGAPAEVPSPQGRPIEAAPLSGREASSDESRPATRGRAAAGERGGGSSMSTEKRGTSALWLAAAAGALAVALVLWFLGIAPLGERIAALEAQSAAGSARRITVLEQEVAALEGGLPTDLEGRPVRIVSGQTSEKDWKKCEPAEQCAEGIYVQITLADAGFVEPPLYLISLHGEGNHWRLTGTASVYNPTKDSFRVYLKDPHGPLTRTTAVEEQWRVSWVAIGTVPASEDP